MFQSELGLAKLLVSPDYLAHCDSAACSLFLPIGKETNRQ